MNTITIMDILYYFSVVLCTRRFIPCAVPLVQLGNTRQTLPPGIKCRSTPSKVAEQDSNFYRGTAASRFFRAYVDVMHAMVQCTQCGQARTFTGLGKSSPCCLAPEFHAARGIERFFYFPSRPFENPKLQRVSVCWVSTFAITSLFLWHSSNSNSTPRRQVAGGSTTILARAVVSSNQQNEFR